MCIEVTPSTMDPQLLILEEPSGAFRYRYKSEMHGAHGHIAGERSQKTSKTLPRVCLVGWLKPAYIRCTLATEKDDKEHPHLLVRKVRKNVEENEPHYEPINGENGWEAEFKVGIIQTAKRDAEKVLREKKLRRRDECGNMRPLTTKEKTLINKESAEEAMDIDLNAVRLRFEALDSERAPIVNSHGNPLIVYSRPILNKKCASNAELKIIKASVTAGSCRGNTEVMLFVDKVDKKNIKIRFFEEDNDGGCSWESYGVFNDCDVHHQYGIVFNTPPYRRQDIEHNTEVFFELVRPKDNERSSAIAFTYQPCEESPGKKRKLEHDLEYAGIDTELSKVAPRETDSFRNYLLQVIPTPDNQVTSSNCFPGEYPDLAMLEMEQLLSANDLDFIAQDGQDKRRKVLKRSPIESVQSRIWAAIGQRDINALTQILDHLDEQNQNINAMCLLNEFNNLGQSSIHLAAAAGDSDILSYLMSRGVDATTAEISGGKTPLHIAARGGHEACVKLLIREAASAVDARDYNGMTALHYAAGIGMKNICETLLDAESDPDTPNFEGMTPLDVALGNEALESVFSKYTDKIEQKIGKMKIEAD